MTSLKLLVPTLVAFGLSFVLAMSNSRFLQDIPNERSLHEKPVPRTGGIALIAGIISGWVLLVQDLNWWIVVPMLGLFALSLLDDMHCLGIKTRLGSHFVAAAIVLSSLEIEGLWMIPTLFYLVWMINLYNFMDGMDGLAGGMAFFGFSFYGIASLHGGDETFALINFTIASAAIGFLFRNFYPARLFMGDGGAIPLGFLAGTLGVVGWHKELWPFWFPVLVFSPFVTDSTFTLLKRLWKKENITLGHRNHYYQRLALMGWGHRKTALYEYILMTIAGGTAIWGMGYGLSVQLKLLAIWSAAYLALAILIDNKWQRREIFIKRGSSNA